MSFIVAVDGLPGAGKTTAIRSLLRQFRLLGFSVKRNSMGDVSLSKEMVPRVKEYDFGCPERASTFFFLRMKQLEAAEKDGELHDLVFMDRFIGSSFAYDLNGNQIPKKFLDLAEEKIETQIKFVLFFDVPFSVACSRKKSATMGDADFARKLERRYQEVAREQNWVRIDATQSPKKVAEDCYKLIMDKFKQKEAP